MGLDMYLTATRFIYDSDEGDLKQRLQEMFDCSIDSVSTNAGYWRKAYHIHLWMVKNVQDGEDDCDRYEVSREQLSELLDIVRDISEDHNKASELLPNESHLEYDDWFFETVEETKTILEKALAMDDNWFFYYHSSW